MKAELTENERAALTLLKSSGLPILVAALLAKTAMEAGVAQPRL